MVCGWIRNALSGTKNESAPGPDGICYRLIKMVVETRLGRELIEDIARGLMSGEGPECWREMRMVLIPKPGKDLTMTKNWRPLNLINCMGKLAEKVVADRIQEQGDCLFHHVQCGLVKGRSTIDILYKSVREARDCLFSGGADG